MQTFTIFVNESRFVYIAQYIVFQEKKGTSNVNCQNAEGLTPLMLVSRDVQLFERLSVQLNRHYSPVEVAQELIKANASVKFFCYYWITP